MILEGKTREDQHFLFSFSLHIAMLGILPHRFLQYFLVLTYLLLLLLPDILYASSSIIFLLSAFQVWCKLHEMFLPSFDFGSDCLEVFLFRIFLDLSKTGFWFLSSSGGVFLGFDLDFAFFTCYFICLSFYMYLRFFFFLCAIPT